MLNKSHLREVVLNEAKRGEVVVWHFDPLSGTSSSLQKEVEEASAHKQKAVPITGTLL